MLITSCNDKQQKSDSTIKSKKVVSGNKKDTTKLYQKIRVQTGDKNISGGIYEGYVSKKKDTIWNQWKVYKNGAIDSSKSKFYELKIVTNKLDSTIKGVINFYSPGDSIKQTKINSREVFFTYLQRENDSLVHKEIKTDKNIIEFDYKDFDDMNIVGFISDLRFVKIDSVPEKLLVNRNYFAIDSDVSTNNTMIELVK
jgi:hypothetical protein